MDSTWLIAIDDTDNADSIGTGRLARMLAARLCDEGLIADASVTRHQLLVHPDVPYTSHNSSACIAAHGDEGAGDKLFEIAQAFLIEHEHFGANPGLCVARPSEIPDSLVELGHRAQRVVLDLSEFDAEVAPHALRVWSRGETGQGRIGAVSGAALRSSGDDGRFIDLRGIRELSGRVTVAEILERTGVEHVESEAGERLDARAEIDTRDWIRPSLRGGRAVFRVRRDGDDWVPLDKRAKEDDG